MRNVHASQRADILSQKPIGLILQSVNLREADQNELAVELQKIVTVASVFSNL